MAKFDAQSDTTTPSESDFSCERSSVSFGAIHVREHERVLGGDTETYMGLSIGWQFKDRDPVSVTELEDQERDKSEAMTPAERMNVLNKYGFSMKELICSEKERKCESQQSCCIMKAAKKGFRVPKFLRKALKR